MTPLSPQEWERRCEVSLHQAQRRREARRVHPWPAGSQWLAALAIAVFVILLGYGVLLAAALVATP